MEVDASAGHHWNYALDAYASCALCTLRLFALFLYVILLAPSRVYFIIDLLCLVCLTDGVLLCFSANHIEGIVVLVRRAESSSRYMY